MGMPWEQMQVSHCPQRTCALAAAALDAAMRHSASFVRCMSGCRLPLCMCSQQLTGTCCFLHGHSQSLLEPAQATLHALLAEGIEVLAL